jgi:hypothetical protein
MSLDQVNLAFGPEEAYKKELFNNFWSTCDEYAEYADLEQKFKTYAMANAKKFALPVVNNPKK